MDRWKHTTAVVTGASSGIGAACVQALLKADVNVIGLARRVHLVEALKDPHDKTVRADLHAYYMDITDKKSIEDAFAHIESTFGKIHILINNAGISKSTMILGAPPTREHLNALDQVIDTNLRGLVHCTAFAYKLMANNTAGGHIVNINSILGHSAAAFTPVPISNVYPATKFGVTALTEVLRQELNYLKDQRVKVSSISPGLVKTEIIAASGHPDSAAEIFQRTPHLQPEDVADAVLFALGTPPTVQVHELTIKPVGERV